MNSTAAERFLRYVTIDTQSGPKSPSQPSTEKQKDLGRLLVQDLLAIGLADAHLDEHGNVYATVPSNTDKAVPVICFCSHMDTAPDFSGKGVKPQVVENYAGGDIQLKGDPKQIIRVAENPNSTTRSATTSSPPTARRCSGRTTRQASPRSSPLLNF